MRYLFLTAFLLPGLECIGQNINTDSSRIVLARDTVIRNQLMTLDLSKFKGQTVESLLQNEMVGNYKALWWTDEPPGKLRSMNLTYARGLYLEIFPVRKDGQAVQFSKTLNFDLEAFKKLKISEVIIDKEFFDERVTEINTGKDHD